MPAIATRPVTFTPLILDGVGPPAVATGYYLVAPTASYRDGVGRVAPLPLQVAIDGVAVTVDLPVTGVEWALKVTGTFVGLTGTEYTTVEYVTIPAGAGALQFEDLPRVDPATLSVTAAPEAAWWTALNAKQSVFPTPVVITYNGDGSVATVTENEQLLAP